jgi:hypothetical protein
MKRAFIAFIAAVALTLALALPASAGAKTGAVNWICSVPGEPDDVTFVSAPAAAEHGIRQANSTAGVVFAEQFGERCRVELVP